jgi:hypothetical protein
MGSSQFTKYTDHSPSLYTYPRFLPPTRIQPPLPLHHTCFAVQEDEKQAAYQAKMESLKALAEASSSKKRKKREKQKAKQKVRSNNQV